MQSRAGRPVGVPHRPVLIKRGQALATIARDAEEENLLLWGRHLDGQLAPLHLDGHDGRKDSISEIHSNLVLENAIRSSLPNSAVAASPLPSPTRPHSPHLIGVHSATFRYFSNSAGKPQQQHGEGVELKDHARPPPSPGRSALCELSPASNSQPPPTHQSRAPGVAVSVAPLLAEGSQPASCVDVWVEDTRLSTDAPPIDADSLAWQTADYLASVVPTEVEFAKQQRLAAEGVASACFLLAECLRVGHIAPRDPGSAIGLYRKAGKKGNPDALYAIGRLYESGELAQYGLPANAPKSLKYFRLAAAMGHDDAAVRIQAHDVPFSHQDSKLCRSLQGASSARSVLSPKPSTSAHSPFSVSPEHSPGQTERPFLSGFSLGRQSSTLSTRSRKLNPFSLFKMGRRLTRAAQTLCSKTNGAAILIAERSFRGRPVSAPASPLRNRPSSKKRGMRKTTSFNSQA